MEVLQKLFKTVPSFSLLTLCQEELEKVFVDYASDELRKGLDSSNTFSNPIQTPIDHYGKHAGSQVFEKRESFEVAWMVAQKAEKDLREISYQDFMRFPPIEKFLDSQHLFSSSVAKIFYAYAKRRYLNFIHCVTNEKFEKNVACLTDNEFISKYPPPWQTINLIFEKNNINYYFEDIPPYSFVEHIPIDFRLIKKSIGKKIELANLSSGEKIIVALIVKLLLQNSTTVI